jgi:hypothetical protein
LDVIRLIGGVLALYIGFQLFQLHELGRRIAILMLSVRMAINIYFVSWLLARPESAVSSGLYFLDKEIYRVANPNASEVFLLVWAFLALIVIIFLSQRETKMIFIPETSNDSDLIVESP